MKPVCFLASSFGFHKCGKYSYYIHPLPFYMKLPSYILHYLHIHTYICVYVYFFHPTHTRTHISRGKVV